MEILYEFNATPVRIPADSFGDIDKLILKFIWKLKRPRRDKVLKMKK